MVSNCPTNYLEIGCKSKRQVALFLFQIFFSKMRSSRGNWTFSSEHPVYKCLPEYEVVSNLIVDYNGRSLSA